MVSLTGAGFIVIVFSFLASVAVKAEHVLTLDSSNFDSEIQKHDFLVAEFYAPWCGHCKSLEPEWEKAAKALKDEGSSIILAKVNADDDKNKPLAQKYKVEGFPTLKIFRKDSGIQDYDGPRDAEGIVSYVKKQAGPATTELATAADAAAFFKENSDIGVVGVFESYDSAEFKNFAEAASALRTEISFAYTTDASFLPQKGPALSVPSIRLFKDFDEGFNDFSDFDVEKIKEFVEGSSAPILVEMNKAQKYQKALSKAFQSPGSKMLLFFDYDAEDADELRKAYSKVAQEKKGSDLVFIIGSAAENDHALKYFGATITDTPLIAAHTPEDKKYLDTELEASDIPKFVEDFLAGKLQPNIKSEDIPAKNSDPVTILVGKNFDSIVLNSKKNVLIEFYAPWCGHCKSLVPIYEEVGKAFAKDDSVVIAKMDATANDVTSSLFDVKGFPTIYFYSAQGKVTLYEGNRTKKDIVNFIQKHKEEAVADSIEEAAEAAELAAPDEKDSTVEMKDEL